jgi:hypothetical protein
MIDKYLLKVMSKEDWIVGGIIVAVLAALGVTIYVLHRRKTSASYQLKKISDGRPIMSNFERVQMLRDRNGNLRELLIRREIHE